MTDLRSDLITGARTRIWGAPQGFDARVVADLAAGGDVLFVARDDVRMAHMAEMLTFFAPERTCLEFPAWDCLPYDRVSPNTEIVSRRLDTLTRLLDGEPGGRAVLTTVSAVLQRITPRESLAGTTRFLRPGTTEPFEALAEFLVRRGFVRSEMVMEPGEFAVRGGILDLFPPGATMPARLDFFGDDIEGIRAFDPTDQRSTHPLDLVAIKPVSEVPLDDESISRFRTAYRTLFAVSGADDPLYESVSAGRRPMGVEHWLPLFHERLETLFDHVPGAAVVLDDQIDESVSARFALIDEYFSARSAFTGDGPLYRPVPMDRMFLGADEWTGLLRARAVADLAPFASPGAPDDVDAGGRPGRDFGDVRAQPDANVYDAVRRYVVEQHQAGRRPVVASHGPGARDRLAGLLREHGLNNLANIEFWSDVEALPPETVGLAVLALERGFVGPGIAAIAATDVLGERLARPRKRRARPEGFIGDVTALGEGDLVVHVDHGIGQYQGLETLQVGGAPHDCLRLIYDGNDRLFLPVENIDMITRYGSEQAGAQLDKLGGAGWQARKARLKQRIRDMAGELIKIAAERAMRPGARLTPSPGLFDEFCARFPYEETEDQARAIDEVVADLAKGTPADRLVCGDVGFGKTEVALRAAFVAVMAGKQVAVVVPTTLLARQHYRTFAERFAEYPVRVGQLSRLVTGKQAKDVKDGMADGRVDVVVGTHALLAKSVRFKDLGLLIVDEEQHFGVAHKERLKGLKADIHVLTLTATPIPRTLQLALTGVRELSLIATPPVDRLAVRTFVLPFDPVIIREALLREQYRGGQTFYVCPRIEDLDGVERRLRDLVPEVKVITAHGQLPARELEDRVSAFYDGKADVLLSTNIIESGLDLPTVNTIVIHRADRFGLAQLYQLRGRVGRSKIRAYAYLTLPVGQQLTPTAEKRLDVMQTLDSLGAGFSLASHDLDIRGAGNLLGGEQSGHIREVGVELYQRMLEEAVAEARGVADGGAAEEEWSPQINLGTAVLIPESYVADLNLRLELYRRIGRLDEVEDIEAFAAEMVDRFGALPQEVDNLLQTMAVKRLCREAGVEKVEAGPKGAVFSFRGDMFRNPAGLVAFLSGQVGTAKLRPDHKLVFRRGWDTPQQRLAGTRRLLQELAKIAAE